jgi:hypothetical protein
VFRENLSGFFFNEKENEMNTPDEDRDVTYNSAYNPFPEPQTIPSGWDTSGFYSTTQTDSVMDEEDSAEGKSH